MPDRLTVDSDLLPLDDATPGYVVLRDLWAFAAGDPWGDTISHGFAVAECLYRVAADIPDSWQFRPGAILEAEARDGVPPLDDDYPTVMVWDMLRDGTVTTDDLRAWGDMLAAYADVLRAAGRDY